MIGGVCWLQSLFPITHSNAGELSGRSNLGFGAGSAMMGGPQLYGSGARCVASFGVGAQWMGLPWGMGSPQLWQVPG